METFQSAEVNISTRKCDRRKSSPSSSRSKSRQLRRSQAAFDDDNRGVRNKALPVGAAV